MFGRDPNSIRLDQEAVQQAIEYSKQLDEAARQSQVAAKQQQQVSTLLKRHEEQVDRIDALIRKWEKSTK